MFVLLSTLKVNAAEISFILLSSHSDSLPKQ